LSNWPVNPLALIHAIACFGSCSVEEDFKGETYAQMAARFGAPHKTLGHPELKAACTWVLVGKHGEALRAGIPSEAAPQRGLLVAWFENNVVTRWRLSADGRDIDSESER